MLTCENSRLSLLLATSDAARVVYASGIWSGALIGRRCSYIVLAIVYERQTNVKCKCNEFTTKKINVRGLYSSLQEAFELHKNLP